MVVRTRIRGGGWVTAAGFGRAGDGGRPTFCPGPPILPATREIFDKPMARFGRFDAYTRLGVSAIGLALSDAGLAPGVERRSVGIISESINDCIETDRAFHASTREAGGALASPNLFSYTLPGIVLGECAVHFGLTGPTFTVGGMGRRGLEALRTALVLIGSRACPIVCAGWIEAPLSNEPDTMAFAGAVFAVLDGEGPGHGRTVEMGADGSILCDGRTLAVLAEIFE